MKKGQANYGKRFHFFKKGKRKGRMSTAKMKVILGRCRVQTPARCVFRCRCWLLLLLLFFLVGDRWRWMKTRPTLLLYLGHISSLSLTSLRATQLSHLSPYNLIFTPNMSWTNTCPHTNASSYRDNMLSHPEDQLFFTAYRCGAVCHQRLVSRLPSSFFFRQRSLICLHISMNEGVILSFILPLTSLIIRTAASHLFLSGISGSFFFATKVNNTLRLIWKKEISIRSNQTTN